MPRTTVLLLLLLFGAGDEEAAAAEAFAAEEVTIVAVGEILMLGSRETGIGLKSPLLVPWRARRTAVRSEWSCRRAARDDTASRGI